MIIDDLQALEQMKTIHVSILLLFRKKSFPNRWFNSIISGIIAFRFDKSYSSLCVKKRINLLLNFFKYILVLEHEHYWNIARATRKLNDICIKDI